jgi:hypothetical protein
LHLPPYEPGRHATAGYPRCRVGVLAPASGQLASCRSIMASVRATGLHPMEVISSGR